MVRFLKFIPKKEIREVWGASLQTSLDRNFVLCTRYIIKKKKMKRPTDSLSSPYQRATRVQFLILHWDQQELLHCNSFMPITNKQTCRINETREFVKWLSWGSHHLKSQASKEAWNVIQNINNYFPWNMIILTSHQLLTKTPTIPTGK